MQRRSGPFPGTKSCITCPCLNQSPAREMDLPWLIQGICFTISKHCHLRLTNKHFFVAKTEGNGCHLGKQQCLPQWNCCHVKKKKNVIQSCPILRPHGLHSPWSSPGQSTRVSSLTLLQGIFPTQASSPGLPRCRRILYQLIHQGSCHVSSVLNTLSSALP